MDQEGHEMKAKARAIAFYLPQYYPIRENDEWWGKGFTEWTNVTKATPLFKGHRQPNLPADLGFYDLRVPETRQLQAELAHYAGISGFCFWHYWFGNGRRLLERPVQEMLDAKMPDFPFCLCWANETWTGIWHGAPNRVLMEQVYGGDEDYKAFFHHLLPYFKDFRYIKINGKPLFVVYRPESLPNVSAFTGLFNALAKEHGFPGLYLVGLTSEPTHLAMGFNAFGSRPPGAYIGQIISGGYWTRRWKYWMQSWKERRRGGLRVYSYQHFVDAQLSKPLHLNEIPVVLSNWDNTPRSGRNGMVLEHATPAIFQSYLQAVVDQVVERNTDENILFIKAWNEWAEGNHLEPNHQYGYGYLKACRQVLLG